MPSDQHPCHPSQLTSIAFSDGLLLISCRACEAKGWHLHGERVSDDAVAALLRARFAPTTGVRRTGGRVDLTDRSPAPAPARRRVVDLRSPARAADPAAQRHPSSA